jgi:hypothetical protein
MFSSSNVLGRLSPEVYEFRLAPAGVSELIMVSPCLSCIFVFTSHNQVWSPQVCDGVLDILLKIRGV